MPNPGANAELAAPIRTVTAFYPDSGYSVLKLQSGVSATVAVLGKAVGLSPAPGLIARVKGRWSRHPRWGMQVKAASLAIEAPTGEEGLVLHLSSALPGVGEKTARRMVETFGERLPDILEQEPMKLVCMSGISGPKARKMSAAWVAQRDTWRVMSLLRDIGLSEGFARRVKDYFSALGVEEGGAIIAKLRANPYLLSEVRGIGFPSADACAARLGIAGDDPRRLRAGAVHAIGEAVSRGGYTGLLREKIAATAAQLLKIPHEAFVPIVEKVIEEGSIVDFGDGFCQPRDLAAQESQLARNLRHLMQVHPRGHATERPADTAQRLFPAIAPSQLKALEVIDGAPLAVLTGGPGMGKTTLTRLIVERARLAGNALKLCSPTGRAAQRLAEATGREAMTVHRMLGFGQGPGQGADLANALVICDEASMLDTFLASKLLREITQAQGARLLMVGDADQLPSVGPGNVLGDIIASRTCPVATLTEVFRQAEGSGIARGARQVLAGTRPGNYADLCFFEHDESEEAQSRVLRLAAGLASKHGAGNVQVLSPMRRGNLGINALNEALAPVLNPRVNPPSINGAQGLLREGDRVVQTKNDYTLDVFNGDTGRIERVDAENRIVHVRFGTREPLKLEGEAIAAVAPAFALTVHKSQGGQYPYVILVAHAQHTALLDRNLVYTGLTRGEKGVAIVGQRKALERACRTSGTWRRDTRLTQRLTAR